MRMWQKGIVLDSLRKGMITAAIVIGAANILLHSFHSLDQEEITFWVLVEIVVFVIFLISHYLHIHHTKDSLS